jgi:hypothetical protein
MNEILFPKIAEEIDTMAALDQRMRRKNLKNEEHWDEQVDWHNAARLDKIIKSIGWPTRSKVGKSASCNAWLIAQHADHDPGFQYECLLLMKAKGPPEVDLTDIAYLEDRVCFNMFGHQIYGTQFTQERGRHIPRPIHDRVHVDDRRAKMGLGTLRQAIRGMYRRYPFEKKKR